MNPHDAPDNDSPKKRYVSALVFVCETRLGKHYLILN